MRLSNFYIDIRLLLTRLIPISQSGYSDHRLGLWNL